MAELHSGQSPRPRAGKYLWPGASQPVRKLSHTVQEIERKSRKMKGKGFRHWDNGQKLGNRAVQGCATDGSDFAYISKVIIAIGLGESTCKSYRENSSN